MKSTKIHTTKHPVVCLKPSNYQPKKVELEEDVRIDASPEDVIRNAFRQVKITENSS